MQAVDAGYNVYGVIDASGALEVTIRDNAVARMKDHGITPINWTTVAAELQRDWRLPTGKDLGRVFHEHYHSYGLLMDSFESVTANAVKKASSWRPHPVVVGAATFLSRSDSHAPAYSP
jgi:hypothetical protein